MLNNISWTNYWITILVLSFIYYIAIYILYFRNALSFQFGKGAKKSVASHNGEADDIAASFDSCINELGTFFENAAGRKWAKEELALALNQLFTNYPALLSSSYRDTLERIVLLQSKDICSVHLNADEVSRLLRVG